MSFQDKLSEHLQNVGEFHDTLKNFTEWLNNAEIAMRSFKYPSKLVEKVTEQIEDHNVRNIDILILNLKFRENVL